MIFTSLRLKYRLFLKMRNIFYDIANMKYDRKVRDVANATGPTGPRPEGGEALHQPSVNGNNIPQNAANANSQDSDNELQRNHKKIRSGDWRKICRCEFSGTLQTHRLFLLMKTQLLFQFSTV